MAHERIYKYNANAWTCEIEQSIYHGEVQYKKMISTCSMLHKENIHKMNINK